MGLNFEKACEASFFKILGLTQIEKCPHPLLPRQEKGSKRFFLFPSPKKGEGLGVRV